MRAILTALLFFPFFATAQHCGYDGAAVIVVRPRAPGDTTVIQGLRITLLDSMNLPVAYHWRNPNLFKPNDDPDACRSHTNGVIAGKPCCFPFAKDNYVLVVPYGLRTETMKVLVQDERAEEPLNKRRDRWPVRFAQQVVPLTAFDSYSLCGTYNDAVYPIVQDRPAYHPVDIPLTQR